MGRNGRLRAVLLLASVACVIEWAVPHVAPAAAATAPLTAEGALARVVRAPWARDPFPTKEELAEARRLLESAAAAEPASAKWLFGLAHLMRLETAFAGDDAPAKRKETKERFEKLVEHEPGVADYQYWLGDTIFEMIDDVGFLSKASLASKGRAAFETAIEIDPSHVAAHYALGVFYSQAPGIAGGSTPKAKAQGEALLKLPGGRGEYWGRMLLAEIAAGSEDWAEMSRQYAAAETARGDGADVTSALQSHILRLLSEKKDPAAALPVIARLRSVAKPDDTAKDFFEGEARRQLGQCAEAVAAYEKVLVKTPAARNTRFGIAECQEKLGNHAEARKHYEEFARQFPKDDRASKARDAANRLK